MDGKDTTWAVVQRLGLVTEKPEAGQILVYGSSDPYPNPAEFFLTQFIASYYRLGWLFFIYRHGKNLPMPMDNQWTPPPGVVWFEYIVPNDLTLGEMARKIYRLRDESVIVAHLPDGYTLRAVNNPEKKWPDGWSSMTIHQFHKTGGWLGGSSIHYLYRLWAEKSGIMLFLCPFLSKGRVYRIYKGFPRPLFVLAPFVWFVPPAKLGLPSWAPTPWHYWKFLPAAFRRRVRKEVMQRILSGEQRIEIQLP
jgi:hypothetical protein